MTIRRFEDLKGKKFGRLVVLKQGKYQQKGKYRVIGWLCKCACGKTKNIAGFSLQGGNIRSCGCLQKEMYKKNKCAVRDGICIICKNPFKYKCIKQLTCGERCAKIYANSQHRLISSSTFERRIRKIFYTLRARSIKRKVLFSISEKFLLGLFKKQDGKCDITKIPFDLERGFGVENPWSMSADQIVPGKGYTEKNTRLVCMIYNFAKHTWKDSDVELFAKKLLEYKKES
jgi:hypothetical protein